MIILMLGRVLGCLSLQEDHLSTLTIFELLLSGDSHDHLLIATAILTAMIILLDQVLLCFSPLNRKFFFGMIDLIYVLIQEVLNILFFFFLVYQLKFDI